MRTAVKEARGHRLESGARTAGVPGGAGDEQRSFAVHDLRAPTAADTDQLTTALTALGADHTHPIIADWHHITVVGTACTRHPVIAVEFTEVLAQFSDALILRRHRRVKEHSITSWSETGR
ncbi:hypothetical protein [Streptomyces platensis]|uniref:hypothetical protein n=1 Tax=Streptomyces platensis TaxID=58346 RepID=UPI0038649491|nr:hypothetical protein OG962_01545 [Streptomyces platensis]